MKIFKNMLTFCTAILLTSVLAVPTSAATNDHLHTFKWTTGQRYFDSPETYRKAYNSATYFRVRDHSMPVNGFYIKPQSDQAHLFVALLPLTF